MDKLLQWDKMRNILDEAIVEMADLLDKVIESDNPPKKVKKAKSDVPAKLDIRRGIVYTTRLGCKCVAMSEPDEDGQFWQLDEYGNKQFQTVRNVAKVHKKESKRMILVLSDMCDNPAAWYNQPIYSGYDE